jgi:hypothetical protein
MPSANIPRLLEVGSNLIINGQVFDGATLSRKTSKLVEIYSDRDSLVCTSSYNIVNRSTITNLTGDRASSNINSKHYIQDSVNPNIYYVITNAGQASNYFYKIDISTWTVQVNNVASQLYGSFILGQDLTNVYAIAMGASTTTYLVKMNKSAMTTTTASWVAPAAGVFNDLKLLYSDAVNGNFWLYNTYDAGNRTISQLTYAQGWTAVAATLSAKVTSGTYAESIPTDVDANRNFWVLSCGASSTVLYMYYFQANSTWTALTQNNIQCTMNWNGFTASDMTNNAYANTSGIGTCYANFLVGTNKVLVCRSFNSVMSNSTPQYNRWWVFDVSGLSTVTCLNTGTFVNNPNYVTKLQKAPDGRYYMFSNGVGLQFFVYNDDLNTLTESTLVPMPNATSYTFDSYGRLWYQLSDYSMYFTDNTTSYDVTMTLDSTTQQYTGSNLSNNLNISTWNYTGTRVSTKVTLYLTGNAYFTSNSSQTIVVTTSTTADTVVPVTITGTGQVNFSAKPA